MPSEQTYGIIYYLAYVHTGDDLPCLSPLSLEASSKKSLNGNQNSTENLKELLFATCDYASFLFKETVCPNGHHSSEATAALGNPFDPTTHLSLLAE